MDAPLQRRSPKAVRRAERNRRYRVRQHAGEVCVIVAVDAAILDFLVATRWLREQDAGDARQIAEAIRLCLKTAARAAT